MQEFTVSHAALTWDYETSDGHQFRTLVGRRYSVIRPAVEQPVPKSPLPTALLVLQVSHLAPSEQ